MPTLLNGIVFGLLLAVLLGPVFFALLQISLEKGYRAGVFFALGVSLSDIIYVVISYFGVTQFSQDQTLLQIAGVIGAIILMILGLLSFFKKIPHASPEKSQVPVGHAPQLIAKGWLINGFNPGALIYWFGVMTLATVTYEYQRHELFIFFAGALGAVLCTDFLKAYLAHSIRHRLSPKVIYILNKVVGVALFSFGVRLMFSAFEGIW